MARRKRGRRPRPPIDATIERLDHEGRGIVPASGETPELAVRGALPGELVRVTRLGRRGEVQFGLCEEVHRPSSARVEPDCVAQPRCGGCGLMHLAHEQQLAHKREVLAELFAARGFDSLPWADALRGPRLGYRRRARLGVRWVEKRGRALVGFREVRDPRFVVDMERCSILAGGVGEWVPALSELIGGLSVRDKLPQIEVAVGEEKVVLIFRVLSEPSASDRAALASFGARHGATIALQTGGLDTIVALEAGASLELSYRLAPWSLELRFGPSDFVQVNAEVNRSLIERALAYLGLEAGMEALDLFCGLGNFSLPMARVGARVHGVEGAESLVERARSNAAHNGLEASFACADLYADGAAQGSWAARRWDRILLDPPRTGAEAIVPALLASGAERIVYVACGPEALARDAAALVDGGSYELAHLALADMFPQTAHFESIACFVRRRG